MNGNTSKVIKCTRGFDGKRKNVTMNISHCSKRWIVSSISVQRLL